MEPEPEGETWNSTEPEAEAEWNITEPEGEAEWNITEPEGEAEWNLTEPEGEAEWNLTEPEGESDWFSEPGGRPSTVEIVVPSFGLLALIVASKNLSHYLLL